MELANVSTQQLDAFRANVARMEEAARTRGLGPSDYANLADSKAALAGIDHYIAANRPQPLPEVPGVTPQILASVAAAVGGADRLTSEALYLARQASKPKGMGLAGRKR